MLALPPIDLSSDEPIYRQLYRHIRTAIESGVLTRGEKLPPTRELAGLLGLNRTTVSAAYELLESEGLIRGHVGRGSYVEGPALLARERLDWGYLLRGYPILESLPVSPVPEGGVSFATTNPAPDPRVLDEFRAVCDEVLRDSSSSAILQLGAPGGYAPLRRYLMRQAERDKEARVDDDVLVTNGCQQAMDLLQRVLVSRGETVLLEDPVYPGLKNVFLRAGARVAGIPVGPSGIDLEHLEDAIRRERPRLLVVSPNFQNPTGTSLSLPARQALLRMARAAAVVVVENDLYGGLRYTGDDLPTLKQLDGSGDTVLLRSFSKVAFPGLRLGWVVGPRPLLARLAEAKQAADLHSCHLSQAVVLRFAESGRLEAHRQRMVAAGAKRLAALLEACETCLPRETRFTRPEGGMNAWVRLPEPLDAAELLPLMQQAGVSYSPGRYFEVSRRDPGGLRLSFAGLAPAEIRSGLEILGRVAQSEHERQRAASRWDPAPAMV